MNLYLTWIFKVVPTKQMKIMRGGHSHRLPHSWKSIYENHLRSIRNSPSWKQRHYFNRSERVAAALRPTSYFRRLLSWRCQSLEPPTWLDSYKHMAGEFWVLSDSLSPVSSRSFLQKSHSFKPLLDNSKSSLFCDTKPPSLPTNTVQLPTSAKHSRHPLSSFGCP